MLRSPVTGQLNKEFNRIVKQERLRSFAEDEDLKRIQPKMTFVYGIYTKADGPQSGKISVGDEVVVRMRDVEVETAVRTL